MDANPLPSSSLESPRARTGQSRLQRSRSASQSSSVFEQRESVGKLPDVKSIKRNSVMSVLDANEREESDPLSSKHDSTMAKTESSSELVQWVRTSKFKSLLYNFPYLKDKKKCPFSLPGRTKTGGRRLEYSSKDGCSTGSKINERS